MNNIVLSCALSLESAVATRLEGLRARGHGQEALAAARARSPRSP